MLYIHHGINSQEQIKAIPIQDGVELDIRYHHNDLVLHHDPFHHHENSPEKFEDFLRHWQYKGYIILNIKTEGIERSCIDLMNRYDIKRWFFLDLSMPAFVLYAKQAIRGEIKGFSPENLAVRFSEYESIAYAQAFVQKARWVWVDCFTRLPLDNKSYDQLKANGYKICLASPELQKHPTHQIAVFKNQIKGLEIDAVCTKYPKLWKGL